MAAQVLPGSRGDAFKRAPEGGRPLGRLQRPYQTALGTLPRLSEPRHGGGQIKASANSGGWRWPPWPSADPTPLDPRVVVSWRRSDRICPQACWPEADTLRHSADPPTEAALVKIMEVV